MKRLNRRRFGPKTERPPEATGIRRPADFVPPEFSHRDFPHRRRGAAEGWTWRGYIPDDADFDAAQSSLGLTSATDAPYLRASFYAGLAWALHKHKLPARTPVDPWYLLVELEDVSRKGRPVGVWRRIGSAILAEGPKWRPLTRLPSTGRLGILKIVGPSKTLHAELHPEDGWVAAYSRYLP